MPSQKEYFDNLSDDISADEEREEMENDLQQIQELLQKSDDNEGIDDEIEALVQGISREEAQSAKGSGRLREKSDTDELETAFDLLESEDDAQSGKSKSREKKSEAKKQAEAKKQQRREKAAAKKAAREEAKQAKKAAKSSKDREESKESRVPRAETEDRIPAKGEIASDRKEEPAGEDEEELLFDTSVLDAIVSKAGLMDEKAVREAARRGRIQQDETDEVSDGTDPTESDGDLLDALSQGEDEEKEHAESGVREVDIEDADIPDFPTVDPDQDDIDLDGIDEKEAEDKGLFDKVMGLLTEEEGAEGGSQEASGAATGQGDGEKAEEAPKEKKAKKQKKAKAKKAAKPKKAKKAKPKKPKKEKEKQPGKKIPLKKLLPVLILCISLGVFILVVVHASVDYTEKQEAVEAYRKGDYESCYQSLFGKKRSEAEEEMYVKSESMLYIRLWIREYEMFVDDGDEVKALDSLIQTVNDYPQLYEYAQQYGAGADVYSEYVVILGILSDKYGLTEEQAMAIAAEPRDIVYTKMVTAIAQGGSYDTWDESMEPEMPAEAEIPIEDLPDVLPEENDLGGENFIGN